MDREERELIQSLFDRLGDKKAVEENIQPNQGPKFSGPASTPKQERPTIYNIGRTSMFGGTSNMMPDPHFFRKLLGIDI